MEVLPESARDEEREANHIQNIYIPRWFLRVLGFRVFPVSISVCAAYVSRRVSRNGSKDTS